MNIHGQSVLRATVRFGGLARRGVTKKKKHCDVHQHGTTRAMLSVGDTWTKKASGCLSGIVCHVLQPSLKLALIFQNELWCFDVRVWTCQLRGIQKSVG